MVSKSGNSKSELLIRVPRVSHLVRSPYGIVRVPFEAVLFPFNPHSQTDTRLLDPPILPSDQYSIQFFSINDKESPGFKIRNVVSPSANVSQMKTILLHVASVLWAASASSDHTCLSKYLLIVFVFEMWAAKDSLPLPQIVDR